MWFYFKQFCIVERGELTLHLGSCKEKIRKNPVRVTSSCPFWSLKIQLEGAGSSTPASCDCWIVPTQVSLKLTTKNISTGHSHGKCWLDAWSINIQVYSKLHLLVPTRTRSSFQLHLLGAVAKQVLADLYRAIQLLRLNVWTHLYDPNFSSEIGSKSSETWEKHNGKCRVDAVT